MIGPGNDMDKLKIVLAGNYAIFLNWCKENQINPRSRDVFYLDHISRLRGLQGLEIELVKLYGYYNTPHLDRIYDYLHSYGVNLSD